MNKEFSIIDFAEQYQVSVSTKRDFAGDEVFKVEGIDADIWSYNLKDLVREYEKFLGLE